MWEWGGGARRGGATRTHAFHDHADKQGVRQGLALWFQTTQFLSLSLLFTYTFTASTCIDAVRKRGFMRLLA